MMKIKAQKKEAETKEKLVNFVSGISSFAQQGKKISGVLDRYYKSIRYYNGDQAKAFRSKKMQRVWNKYAEIFENRIASIVSKRPKWKYNPQGNNDILNSDVANQILGDVLWEKIEWEDRGEDSLLEGAHAGSCHIKTVIGNDRGLPDFVVVPADCVDPDPKAKTKNQLRFLIHYIDKGTSQIYKEYGAKVVPDAALEKMDVTGNFQDPEVSFESQGDFTMPSQVWAESHLSDLNNSDLAKDVLGKARIAEVYYDDDAEENIPFNINETVVEHESFKRQIQKVPGKEENHVEHLISHNIFLETLDSILEPNTVKALANHIAQHSQYDKTEKRPKYPYGRLTVICQGKLLKDVAVNDPYTNNEIPLHWKDMWIKWDFSKLPQSYWGKCMGKDLIDIQDAINHRKNSITQNIDLLNQGIKKLNVKTYADLKKQGKLGKLNNLTANIIPVYDKDDLTVDFGNAFPPQIFQDLYHDEQFGDTIMGHSEIQSGKMPSASASGVTVNTLLQEGGKRANLAVKHYAFGLQQMARNAITILKAVGDDDLMFGIVDKDKVYQNVRWADIKDGFSIENIRIDIQSFTGTSREQKRQEARADYRDGLIDREAAYEYSDDPNKWETLQRISEVNMLKQALEQQQEKTNLWKGHFQNISQNHIRQSISLEEEKEKNKKKDEKKDAKKDK